MSAADADATLAATERVARVLEAHSIPAVLIGGTALAAHGYVRATLDVDLAIAADPFRDLPKVMQALIAEGFEVELNEPDAVDPLGGVLNITAEGIDPIQIVNYLNPLGGGHPLLGREAIESGGVLPGTALRVVDVPHLVALKLYAGTSLKTRSDVQELLERHPEVDRGQLGALCERFGLSKEWALVLADLSG